MTIGLDSQTFQTAQFIFVVVSLASLVFALGLKAKIEDLLYVLRRPRLLLGAILSVHFIVPISAGLIVLLLPLWPTIKAAILLMALSPVPPTVPGIPLEAGERTSYACGLYMALVPGWSILLPLAIFVADRVYGGEFSVPASPILGSIALEVVIPLGAGLAVRQLYPGFAARASRKIAKISLLLLVIGEIPVLATTWPIMLALVGNGTLLAMALVGAIGLVSGHLLGGSDPAKRSMLAIASTNRHPGVATIIANANMTDERISAAILLFLLAAAAMTFIYTWWAANPKTAQDRRAR